MRSKLLSNCVGACVIAALFSTSPIASAVNHVVNVGQGGNVFVPNTVNATVGLTYGLLSPLYNTDVTVTLHRTGSSSTSTDVAMTNGEGIATLQFSNLVTGTYYVTLDSLAPHAGTQGSIVWNGQTPSNSISVK